MAKNRRSKRQSWQFCKPVIASALAIGGVFNLVGIVLAEGTAAGTQITNTATATYRDPEGTPQTSTSNTVVVEVAEIAGITITNTAADRYNFTTDTVLTGAVEPGDDVQFVFEVTNVGNDETDISLPAVADFTGPVESILSIKADLDGNGEFETDITSRTDIENVASGESFDVQVVVRTSTTAQSDDVVTVQYGDTPGDGQNQAYDSSGGSVFTDDNDAADAINVIGPRNPLGSDDGVPDESLVANTPSQTPAEAGTDTPANGEREASATGQITIDEEPLEQPLVKLEKSINSHNTGGNTNPADDTIIYNLKFDVLRDTDVPAGSNAQAADLQSITINGLGTKHVLISDAVPEGTIVQSTTPSASTPITVNGVSWEPVYTLDDPLTTSAMEATWQRGDAPAGATRVGFISDADAVIPMGTTMDGFQITLSIDSTNVPSTVANIAQVFGSGDIDDPLTPEDESLKFPVVDESGDQTPSNYDPNTDTYSSFNPDVIDNSGPNELPDGFTPGDGYISDPSDLIEQGIDPGSDTPNDDTDDNTGDDTDGDGEAIVITVIAESEPNILNGPDGAPGAVGPTGTNDDFTNKSVPYSDGDPPVVAFTNTVANNDTPIKTTEDGWVRLEPIAPGDTAALPNNTTATIIAPDGTRTTFTYDGAGSWTQSGPDVVVPIRADDGAPGGDDEFDYGVEVDLPDDATNISELDSFPVPIQATFAGVSAVQTEDTDNGDTNGGTDGAIDTKDITAVLNNSTTTNITIDRVYTGFLELVKTAQVIRGDGPEVSGNPAPGNHIRYRVNYRNLSETEVGTMQGNVLLTASDLRILEDGTERACDYANLTEANNWALDNDNSDGEKVENYGTDIDTRHVDSSVNLNNLDAGSTGTVLFFSGQQVCDAGLPAFDPAAATPTSELSGTTHNTDTTKYVFDITGDIEPLESGYVEFERRIN